MKVPRTTKLTKLLGPPWVGAKVFINNVMVVTRGTRMWVDDEVTRAWMRELYTNRFVEGMSTIDSVHEASLALLYERREKGLSTHPFYWAGFIASGDWR